MKRTYRKSIIRTVRQSLSRFMAIFAIVALGVGFLAGLLSATPDMRYSADKVFDETELFDLRIVGTLGLSDDDVAAVRAIEGVQDIMPVYSVDALVNTPGGDTLVTKIQSVPLDQIEQKEPTGYINRMEVVEGRLPVKDDECVVGQNAGLYSSGVSVGDTLTISEENEGVEDTFTRTELKVVGVVKTSTYFSVERESASVGNGTLDLVVYTGEQNFALDVWTDLYVTVEGAKAYDSLLDEYADYVDVTAQKIEDISEERSEIRYQQVKDEAQRALADARKEYEDKKEEAEQKLSDAEQQLADGREELEQAESELNSAKEQIASGEAELQANKDALPGTLTSQLQQFNEGQAQLIEAKAQYEAGQKEIETQEQALADAKTQLTQTKQLVQTLQPVLTQAENTIPVLEQRIPTLQQSADSAQALADQLDASATKAEQAAQQAHETSALPQLQETLNQAQAAIDSARGDATEEEWAEENPVMAAPLIAARDQAKAAVDAEQARLNGLDQAAQQARLQANAAQQQADAAKTLVTETQTTIDATKQSVAETQAQLDEANRQIAENEPKIAEGEKQLTAAKQKLADAQKQITEAEKQLAQGETSLSLAPDLAKLQLDLAQEKLDNSKEQVAEGETQLEDARKEFKEGEAEYNEKKQDAEQQLADAEQQLADAQKQIDELEVPQWYVLTRDQNVSFASFKANVQKVEAVAGVFPVFFFLVAALVALTTMTRMVEEERLQIGTMKALGYSKAAIMAKYIAYAMTATIAGCAVGLAIGLNLFPAVIWNAYSTMYALPKIYCLFNIKYSAIASGAAILCTLFATVNACWGTLMEVPAALMLPKAPKAGKRILLERIRPVWKRMKFTHKVTARNLFRYKKRFFMTVIGIAGCTSLLVSGFGLHDSISDVVYKQYGNIFRYDAMVSVKHQEDAESSELKQVLNGTMVKDYMLVHQEQSSNDFDGETLETYLFVPQESAQLSRFVNLHERKSGDAVNFSQDGIIITEKMSERANVSVGDVITLTNKDDKQGSFRVDGIVENYIENYVYMSAETYESQFGTAPEFTGVLIQAEDTSTEGRDALSQALLDLDGVSSVSFVDDFKQTFNSMLEKIDVIVVVLIISAGVLAFVVLYNLTNINITERTKEIATIKVLGFYDGEVSAYVYRESVVLSIIGTVVGLILGVFLHVFIIQSVEVDAVMFGRTIKALSFVFSAALTLFFSFLVNLVMHRKLTHISMVESMKAPE